MDKYLEPIKIAIITFPFIAAIFTVPFLIFQYKKYGYVNKIRLVIVYSLLLFLINAYYLVILPLPNIERIHPLKKPITEYMQLIPFTFIFDFLKETKVQLNEPSTYLMILKERAFLQVILNVMLLMPLGVYCRYYFRKSLGKTVLITFLISLFFEITQITGLYGIYEAPYRLFDVDDLMLNTFGGMIGYLLAPKITYFLPGSDKFDVGIDLKSMQVGFIRRFVGAGIDILINFTIITVFNNLVVSVVDLLLYYIILPYITNGITLGKLIVRIKIKGRRERITFKEILKRNGILFFTISIQLVLSFISPVFVLVYNLTISGYILYKTIKNDKILFYERISGTKNVIVCNEKDTLEEENIDLQKLNSLNKVALHR